MCGEIFVFDQGVTTFPRYFCAKIPKQLRGDSVEEIENRFVVELSNQLKFNHHPFVHWAYDFQEVAKVPAALFNYYGSDLNDLIKASSSSLTEKLSILSYICCGLEHCYSRGLVSHQDLKPQNIFLKDLKQKYTDLPKLDVFNIPLIADFGLSNASIDFEVYEGSRPYMAPEQWEKAKLSAATDVFALGVIAYQFLSDGQHPIGIKLHEFWPVPVDNNSKKWTRSNPWKDWTKSGCEINHPSSYVPHELLALIRGMISVNPLSRPSICEAKNVFLEYIKHHDPEASSQCDLLISHYNSFASAEPLNERWPHLYERWESFKIRFCTRA
jgi:eukaryotic-like serine/threonine-protein kinase